MTPSCEPGVLCCSLRAAAAAAWHAGRRADVLRAVRLPWCPGARRRAFYDKRVSQEVDGECLGEVRWAAARGGAVVQLVAWCSCGARAACTVSNEAAAAHSQQPEGSHGALELGRLQRRRDSGCAARAAAVRQFHACAAGRGAAARAAATAAGGTWRCRGMRCGPPAPLQRFVLAVAGRRCRSPPACPCPSPPWPEQEFKGYVFKIMGGQDKQGFPMKQGVLTNGRVQVRHMAGAQHVVCGGQMWWR